MWCESLLHSQPKAPCLVISHSSCATSAVTGRYACHWGQHYRDGNLCSIKRKHGTQYLLSFDMVSRWEIQEKNGKVKIPTPKKNQTKEPYAVTHHECKISEPKALLFSCAWVQKGEVPSEDWFYLLLLSLKILNVVWQVHKNTVMKLSWVAIWKWCIQRCKKAWGENCRCWKKNQQCTWMRLKIADN